MRKNQILPIEILQRLQFDHQPESFCLSLGKALNKLFSLPLLEISWGIKSSENFTVFCYQKREGEGSSSTFSRQLNQSLGKDLIDDETAFVIEDFSEENEDLIEVRKAYLMGAEQLIVLPLFDRLGVNGFINLYLSEKTEVAYWELLFSQLCPISSAMLSFHQKLNKTANASRRAWSDLRDIKNENMLRGPKPFVKESEAMQDYWNQLCILAPRLDNFWICGTAGSGRELSARHIHARSGNASKRFEAFDCSQIPQSLHKAEIFGDDQSGLWFKLNGGTLYLKNIEDLSADARDILLKKIADESRFSTEANKLIISSESETIEASIFDLFGKSKITLPHFNQRRDDWLWLLRELSSEIAASIGVPALEISPAFTQFVMQKNWSDDFSEIREFLTKALVSSRGRTLKVPNEDGKVSLSKAGRPPANLDQSVQQQIIKALRKCKGKVYGADGAAAVLGLHPSTLQGKMRKFKISNKDFKNV